MAPGIHRSGLIGSLVAICALIAACFATAPATASERPVPPSAAQFERATEALLDDPEFRASPRLVRAGGSGGVGTTAVVPGESLFPASRVLSLYGAPQLKSTALGKLKLPAASRLVTKQSVPYERLGERPVIPSFDLIGVVANSTRGADRMYRTRQPPELIAQYLESARDFGGRLVIDIQPGRSPVLAEIDALEEWIAQPDVDVAIDPEWNVGRRGVPGVTPGSITALDLNAASRRIQQIVDENGLPPKLMVVHQFSKRSIRRRTQVKQRPGVTTTLNFDGIGGVAPKVAGFEALATEGLFNGFSLFYDLDTPLMKPGAVLALEPEVDFILYQ